MQVRETSHDISGEGEQPVGPSELNLRYGRLQPVVTARGYSLRVCWLRACGYSLPIRAFGCSLRACDYSLRTCMWLQPACMWLQPMHVVAACVHVVAASVIPG